MARQIQLRRGTAEQHEQFIGADGEVTVDTTNKTLRVHDGTTPGGVMLARTGEIPQSTPIPDTADYVIEYQHPSAENNYTWYRKYKSGWVEQGGIIPQQASADIIITFPVEMSDTNYWWTIDLASNSTGTVTVRVIGAWAFNTTCMTSRTDTNFKKTWVVQGLCA